MVKSNLKIIFSIFLIALLISSCCFATTEPEVTATLDSSNNAEEADLTASEELPDATPTNEQDPESNETEGDIYICQSVVNISNDVSGNAYIIGDDVTISGRIEGDLFVIAKTLTVNEGYIYNNIFALANNIHFNGVVYNFYACANSINIDSKGFIFRDMKAMAENINISGGVQRNAFLGTSNLTFADDSSTHIGGNLEYSSEKEITVPEGTVLGEVKFNQETTTSTPKSHSILSYVVDLLKTLLFTFVIVLLLLWLTPKFVKNIGNTGVNKALASLGIGLLSPICLTIAGVILIFTIIGLPIFICTMFAFLLLTYIGFAVTSLFFGKLLTKQFKMEGNINLILFTLLSSLALWIIGQIPFVGWLVLFVAYMFGVGLTLVHIFWKKENKKEESKEN